MSRNMESQKRNYHRPSYWLITAAALFWLVMFVLAGFLVALIE